MNQKFDWQERGSAYYFYDVVTGKIVGQVSKIVLSENWIALVNVGKYTLTLDDEKHLGQYIDLTSAKKAVEYFWDIQNRTLIGG